MNIFELLDKSDFTTIGFQFRNERKLKRIISKIPHNFIELNRNNEIENIKQIFRDYKINSVLGIKNYFREEKIIILDISTSYGGYNKNKKIDKIRKYAIENNKKIIILAPISSSKNYSKASISIRSRLPSQLLYSSDLVLSFVNVNEINIIKNRYGKNEAIKLDI